MQKLASLVTKIARYSNFGFENLSFSKKCTRQRLTN